MKQGIFGGTFDPIHIGHLIMAEEARTSFCLDKILFVPAGNPMLKQDDPGAGSIDRLRMVELAIKENSQFEASAVEVKRDGPSYTVETLEELARVPTQIKEMFLLVGFDALAKFRQWHKPRRLFELATIVSLPRPGYKDPRLDLAGSIGPLVMDKLVDGGTPLMSVSSSEIRRRVVAGLSIRYLVPKTVEDYIMDRGLYRK